MIYRQIGLSWSPDLFWLTSKEKDEESSLQYFEARYYNHENGRFYSQDRVFWELGITERGINTLVDPQSLNGYAYARNNPLIYTDPSGEEITIGGIVSGVLGLEYCGGSDDDNLIQLQQNRDDSIVPGFILSAVTGGGGTVVIKSVIKQGGKLFIKETITQGGKVISEKVLKTEVKIVIKNEVKAVTNQVEKIFTSQGYEISKHVLDNAKIKIDRNIPISVINDTIANGKKMYEKLNEPLNI